MVVLSSPPDAAAAARHHAVLRRARGAGPHRGTKTTDRRRDGRQRGPRPHRGAAAGGRHADEDLERVAALRRRTAAAPAWTPEDDEELAAPRLKAAAVATAAAPGAIRRKAPQELATTVTPDGSFNTSDEDAPHSSVEDFSIERSIGKGAFGEVFLARSKLSGRTYAIKTIPRSKAGDERSAFAVRHPFVIKLRWVLYDSTDAWLVMDYAPRGTLASHLERRPGRRLPIAHARLVSAELSSALRHAAGVVHRDSSAFPNVVWKS